MLAEIKLSFRLLSNPDHKVTSSGYLVEIDYFSLVSFCDLFEKITTYLSFSVLEKMISKELSFSFSIENLKIPMTYPV